MRHEKRRRMVEWYDNYIIVSRKEYEILIELFKASQGRDPPETPLWLEVNGYRLGQIEVEGDKS